MKSLLQTQEWVDLKVEQGWQAHKFEDAFILQKKLPGGQSFLYVPEIEWEKAKNFNKKNKNFREFFQSFKPIFIRLEILDKNDGQIGKELNKNGFIKAFEELQPEWRQVVDVSKTEEEILNQMKPKGRYNIRVAQKHHVKASVCPADRLNEGINSFYRLYEETARYQKISLRKKDYFKLMLEKLYPLDEAAVVLASYNEVPLAALIITFYDGVASYLYGGTSREYKNVMAPYAAHWEAILEAKRRNCQKYDLLAVSPEGEEKHKYSNLSYFKGQFGGEKINVVGSYDYILKPGWYKIFKTAERFRRR